MPHDILPVVSGNNLRKIWQKLLATFPTRTQVITLIEENAKLKKEVVQELPTENINTNCIYLVPDPNGTARNVYNEYMYIIDEQTQQGNWELIGNTRVDMTQYYTKTQTDRMLLDKQNRTDNDLPTESKTITGAISEIFITLSNFISSTGTAITSLINRVTKLEPIQGTTADIMQKFNDGEIPEGYYAESWDDDVTEFAIPITSEQYEALTEAQKTSFNYLLTDGLPGGMLLMDNYPREGSNNAVKSKGLYEKFDEQQNQIDGIRESLAWSKIGTITAAAPFSMPISAYNEVRIVMNLFGDTYANHLYLITMDLIVNSIIEEGAISTWVAGFGGRLNNASPEGGRAIIQTTVSDNTIRFAITNAIYDNVDESSTVIAKIYAR